MKVLVLGSGGREHALAWKLATSSSVEEVLVIPGNPGMLTDAKISLDTGDAFDFEGLYEKVLSKKIDLIVVGPENLLEAGIVDFFEEKKIAIFGPRKDAAQLETSKAYFKEFSRAFHIPTASFEIYDDYDQALKSLENWDFREGVVVKADCLAAGKGVVVTHDKEEAKASLYDFMVNPGCSIKTKKVVIEKKLLGKELSLFFLCDGDNFFRLGMACDYKRVADGNTGPNTGGMGCYTPRNWPSSICLEKINKDIVSPTLKGMKERGTPFKGVLFVGLMVDGDDANVVEYNVRFGDPETQTLMPPLKGDFATALLKASRGELSSLAKEDLSIDENNLCVHVVMASKGYPSIGKNSIETGYEISYTQLDHKIFFAGVKKTDAGLVNSGGRVLGVSALGGSVEEARKKAYGDIEKIQFQGAHWRTDIGN